MKKMTKFSVGALVCACACSSFLAYSGNAATGKTVKPVEFLTAEVGDAYVLPYWIQEMAESVTLLDPAKKEVKEAAWGYPLNSLGEYSVQYVVNGKTETIALHVADTTAPGFLPLNINYTIAPDFSLYVNAGEEVDLDDIFISQDNSGKVAKQYYEVCM